MTDSAENRLHLQREQARSVRCSWMGLLVALLALAAAAPAAAQMPVRSRTLVEGNYTVTGNDFMDCAATGPCSNNNSSVLHPVDRDPLTMGDLNADGSDDTTVSSAATLSLPAAAVVRRAELIVYQTNARGTPYNYPMADSAYTMLLGREGDGYTAITPSTVTGRDAGRDDREPGGGAVHRSVHRRRGLLRRVERPDGHRPHGHPHRALRGRNPAGPRGLRRRRHQLGRRMLSDLHAGARVCLCVRATGGPVRPGQRDPCGDRSRLADRLAEHRRGDPVGDLQRSGRSDGVGHGDRRRRAVHLHSHGLVGCVGVCSGHDHWPDLGRGLHRHRDRHVRHGERL